MPVYVIFSWFFHSQDDNVVCVEETDKIVAALRKCGACNNNMSMDFLNNTHKSVQIVKAVIPYGILDTTRARPTHRRVIGWWGTIAGPRHTVSLSYGIGFSHKP